MSENVYFNASSFDSAAKGYFTAIKQALRPEKFHVQAPTPQLLRKAQKAAVSLRRPIPRDAKGRILPHPSRGTKSDIFKKEDFKDVDHHALNAPSHLLIDNIEELVDYLINPFPNDKVSAIRAIFRWISGQDLRYYQIQSNVSSNSVAFYLNELKSGKGRYDKLFNRMCEHAQIPSATISGHSKGIGYNVGDPLTSSTRNMWNAVLLDEDWYLIDVHWASRKVSGIEAEEWQPLDSIRQNAEEMTTPKDVYEFDEFYFLTDPEEFIYSHFPDQEVWQLLARPMTFAEFQKVILLKPKFFQFGMKVKSHPWCTLKSVDGAVNIELTTEREDISFSYELYKSTKINCGDERLQKYLFLERKPEEKKVCIEIQFPTTGKFKAEIYGRDATSKLEWLCSYVLYCEKAEADCHPLPTNLKNEWGPTVDMKNAGVIPLTHKTGKIELNHLETEIKFKLETNVNLISQLMTIEEENLDNHVLLGIMDNIATIYIRMPQKGQYALCIFAQTEADQQQFINIGNYLVICTDSFGDVEPYPQTINSRVGPLDTFYNLGLEMVDPIPALSSVSKDGKHNIKVFIPEGIAYFPRMTMKTKEDFSDYIIWSRNDDIINFHLRFPMAGFYKFSLFAKSEIDEGGYPEVLCLIFEVPWPMMNCLPFPKKFTSYKDTYIIYNPDQRLLAIDKTEKVKVFLPDANDVACIDGGSWTHLSLNENGLWEGELTPTGIAETISMAAKLSNKGEHFASILSFEVIPQKDLDRIFLTQRLSREEAEEDYLERQSKQNVVSQKSQGNSMMNQIQRIAKMKQQNMDDEMLQWIQLQVEEEEEEEKNFQFSSVNGQVGKENVFYLESNRVDVDNYGNSDNYSDLNEPIHQEICDLINYKEEEEEEEDENFNDDDDDDNFELSGDNYDRIVDDEDGDNDDDDIDVVDDDDDDALTPNVDINLNEISNLNVNKTFNKFCPQTNSPIDTKSFFEDTNENVQKFEKHSFENIPFQFHEDNFKSDEENLENDNKIFQVQQLILEKPVQPFGSTDDFCENLNLKLIHSGNEAVSVRDFDKEISVPIKAKFTYEFNTTPPPPPSPEVDFTETLVKRVNEMEKSVVKDELALKSFSYEELTKMDKKVLRQRQQTSETVDINSKVSSENTKVASLDKFEEIDEEKEVPLIKFVEYFFYFISLCSLLVYIYRILSWRPY